MQLRCINVQNIAFTYTPEGFHSHTRRDCSTGVKEGCCDVEEEDDSKLMMAPIYGHQFIDAPNLLQ